MEWATIERRRHFARRLLELRTATSHKSGAAARCRSLRIPTARRLQARSTRPQAQDGAESRPLASRSFHPQDLGKRHWGAAGRRRGGPGFSPLVGPGADAAELELLLAVLASTEVAPARFV